MQALKIANRTRTLPVLLYTGVPFIITAGLWATSLYEVTLPQVIAAFILCWIPWAAYKEWVRGPREKIPLFVLIGVMYWLAYAVPLFWTKHQIGQIYGIFQAGHTPKSGTMELLEICIAICGIAENRSADQYAWRGRPSVPSHH